jgi:uncharacterized protein (DUF362 family)
MMSLVSLVRIRGDTVDSIKQAILESTDLIDFKFPSRIEKVVIKPNMCYYWDYSTGLTTNPRFVAATIELIREKTSSNVDISIVESDASAMKCIHVFKMLGFEKLSQNYGVKLVNLSQDQCDPTQVTVRGRSIGMMIPHTILKADLKINIPKIKYAARGIKLTCALKNIFGCNPYPKKFRLHARLDEAIIAVNKAMKFDLCLLDGIIVTGMQPRKLGLAMASEDVVAFDTAAARIAGINPSSINYIRLAHNEGLGNTSIVTRGSSLEQFKSKYPKYDVRKKLINRAYGIIVRSGLRKRLGVE